MANKKLEDLDKVQPVESGAENKNMGFGYASPYAGQIGEIYEQISNRKPFEYDVNADAMYQALKDQYVAGGQMAMQDTMGQAQAMTGGYGNSYAQSVGQQAYNNYIRGLTDQMPDFYQLALQNYMQQGDQMLQQYGMLQDLDAQGYNRYMDSVAMVQPQVLEMLQQGIRPSQDMLAASGLTQEYVDALYPVNAGSSGPGWRAPAEEPEDGSEGLEEIRANVDYLWSIGTPSGEVWKYMKEAGLDSQQRREIFSDLDKQRK